MGYKKFGDCFVSEPDFELDYLAYDVVGDVFTDVLGKPVERKKNDYDLPLKRMNCDCYPLNNLSCIDCSPLPEN